MRQAEKALQHLNYALDAMRRLRKLRQQAEETALERMTREEREQEERRIDAAYRVATAMVDRLRARVQRDESLPRFLRVICLGCRDTGRELCREPNGSVGVRPCSHCEKGRTVLAAWRRSGPYSAHVIGEGTPAATSVRALTDHEVNEVMAWPCAHDPADEMDLAQTVEARSPRYPGMGATEILAVRALEEHGMAHDAALDAVWQAHQDRIGEEGGKYRCSH